MLHGQSGIKTFARRLYCLTRLHRIACDDGVPKSFTNCLISSAVNIVIHCVSEFSKKYPNIFIDVVVVTGASQIRAINNNEADIHITFSSLLVKHSQLNCLELMREHFSLLFCENFDKDINPNDLSALKNLPLVSYLKSEAPFLTDRIFEICRNRNLEPINIHWCNSMPSVLIAVKAGLGFTVSPVSGDGFQDGLRVIPLEGADTIFDHSIGWRQNSNNHATAFFLDVVKKLYPACKTIN
jgi:DNA-binding transcriptional LysR family regulator